MGRRFLLGDADFVGKFSLRFGEKWVTSRLSHHTVISSQLLGRHQCISPWSGTSQPHSTSSKFSTWCSSFHIPHICMWNCQLTLTTSTNGLLYVWQHRRHHRCQWDYTKDYRGTLWFERICDGLSESHQGITSTFSINLQHPITIGKAPTSSTKPKTFRIAQEL